MTDTKDRGLPDSTDTMHGSPFPTLATLHDAITDSPIYRANINHWDDQFDLLDKWLQNLTIQLKLYTEKLNRFAADASVIHDKMALPLNMDDALMTPCFTGEAARRLTDALQATLALQMKVASDAETCFVQPLHQLVRAHVKKYKEFRKQHDKVLEQYETQLQKYSACSKIKDASTWREEAFRLYEARKAYTLMSSQHVMDMVEFRCNVTNFLAEQSSYAALMQQDYNGGVLIWENLKQSLGGWMQWLSEDRHTCAFEFQQFQQTRKKLEMEYTDFIRPQRDISFYAPTAISIPSSLDRQYPLGSRWGYLFLRTAKNTWTRKWCFLHGGYFGWCSLSKSGQRSVVILDERLSIAMYSIRQAPEFDRGFCFEITAKDQQSSHVLQSETWQDMSDWISRFEKTTNSTSTHSSKRSQYHASFDKSIVDSVLVSSPVDIVSSESNILPGSPVRLFSKSKFTTTMVSAPRDIPVTLSSTPGSSVSCLASVSDISGLSTSSGTQSNDTTDTSLSSGSEPSIVTYASSSGEKHAASLHTSLTLSPLLLWEASDLTNVIYEKLPSSYWGIPLPLLAGVLMNSKDLSLDLLGTAIKTTDTEKVVWPPVGNVLPISTPDIAGYTSQLDAENHTLHRLFGGASSSEVVLEVFMCYLKRHPNITQSRESVDGSVADEEPKDDSVLRFLPASPSKFGYGYTGKAFVTQDTLWFYSSVILMSVNTVAIKLKDIKDIHMTRDCLSASSHSSSVLIELCVDDRIRSVKGPIIFAAPTEDTQLIVRKLHFLVENAKNKTPLPLQQLYNELQSLSQKQDHAPLLSTRLSGSNHDSQLTVSLKKAAKRPSFRSVVHPAPLIIPKDRVFSSNRPPEATGCLYDKHDTQPSSISGQQALQTTDESSVQKAIDAINPVDIAAPVDPDDLPADVTIPSGPLSCQCDDHPEKLDFETEFPISAKRLYEVMFSEEQTGPAAGGGVWLGKTEGVLGHDLRVSTWEEVDGRKQRILKYIMPVTNPIVRVKEAEVEETQVILKEQDHLVYVVEISTKTRELPYADAFIPSVRYCITFVNKSRCKLSCYTGVKWVKSVFVRGIVTRAAMSGMANSIAVFIPVLNAASEKIAAQVEAERDNRQAEYERAKTKLPRDDKGPGVTQKSLISTSLVNSRSPNTVAPQSEANGTTAYRDRAVSEPDRCKDNSTSTAVGENPSSQRLSNDDRLNSSSSLSTTATKTEDTAVNSVGSVKLPRSADPFGVETLLNLSIRLFRQLVPCHQFSLIVIIFAIILWVYRPVANPLTCSQVHNEKHAPGETKTGMVSASLDMTLSNTHLRRAVYLRDLEEGVFQKQEFELPYMNTPSFQKFLRSKNASSSNESYRWFTADRYETAVDLEISRERIAAMRHDILVIFKTINKVDSQLYKDEYVNWLLDGRTRCRNSRYDEDHGDDDNLYPSCHEVYKQLRTFFHESDSTSHA